MTVYVVYLCEDNENLQYFLQHGYQVTPDIVYIFIKSTSESIPESAIYYQAKYSFCFDNWTDAMSEYKLYDKMTENDKVIFIDSISRGPFVKENWTEKLTSLITSTVKLAGCSINCYNDPFIRNHFSKYEWNYDYYPHVQSFLLVTDKTGLEIGYNNGIFSINNDSLVEKIYRCEIGFSIAILTNNYNISCMLQKYQNKNYVLPEDMTTNCNGIFISDPFNSNSYFGGNVDPREALFINTTKKWYLTYVKPILDNCNSRSVKNKYCVYITQYNSLVNPYNEMAKNIMKAINDLGYECIYSNSFKEGYKHVVFGAHILCQNNIFGAPILSQTEIPADSIIVNLEKLNDSVNSCYVDILRKYTVWDCSQENINWLNSNKIIYNVRHLPIGYFNNNQLQVDQDIDVLVYGFYSERRWHIYDMLKSSLPDKNIVFEISKYWDQNLILRSKIILNINNHDIIASDLFHITYLLSLKSFVITENNSTDLAAGCVTCEYYQLVDTVTKYLDDNVSRETIANNGYELVKSKPQTVPLRNSITNKIILSILICSMDSRVENDLPNIFKLLKDQVQGLPVEIIALVDNRKMSIGEKRNRLIEIAKGDYIIFVDDDDYVSTDYVELLLRAIEEDSDIVVFILERYENGRFDRLCYYSIEYDEDVNYPDKYIRLPNNRICIRKTIAEKVKYLNISHGEDIYYASELKKYIRTQTKIDKVIYRYMYDSVKSTC